MKCSRCDGWSTSETGLCRLCRHRVNMASKDVVRCLNAPQTDTDRLRRIVFGLQMARLTQRFTPFLGELVAEEEVRMGMI